MYDRDGRFVTAGKDGFVQVWQASEGAGGPRGRTLDIQEMLGAGWGPGELIIFFRC